MQPPGDEKSPPEQTDGPVVEPDPPEDTPEAMQKTPNTDNGEAICHDRAELIERLKRGESPTWVPNQSLQKEYLKANGEELPIRSTNMRSLDTSSLLPAAEIQGRAPLHEQLQNDQVRQAMEIKRPRSALHAGDFDENHTRNTDRSPLKPRVFVPETPPAGTLQGPLGTSPTTPWYIPSPYQGPLRDRSNFRERDYDRSRETSSARSRAPSVSSVASSNYILKAPTTPLVQQSNNSDYDFNARDRSTSPDKNGRRHTLPPNGLNRLHESGNAPSSHQQRSPWVALQRDPHSTRDHASRHSLNTAFSLQSSSPPPHLSWSHSRRASFSSEASPLQHASMVGSYEESILHGRMSAAPSRPLDFTAQIGVMGKANCKPKCPPHITVPFPAVYYSWRSGQGRRPDNDEPSPYVGQIELNGSSASNGHKANQENLKLPPSGDCSLQDHVDGLGDAEDAMEIQRRSIKSRKRRRTSPSKTPPQGSYRIPEQGQLQIVIKNPNKTAVKLFLVPYDLTGMEPGTKTFIRQRLMSAGPILENPLASTLASRRRSFIDVNTKHTLRYLIHLNICSPSKGRFYLYQHIRVVFANRVPDNKEQLRTETQVPEPRFGPWKPFALSRQSSSSGAKLTAEKTFRRRSSGFGYGEDTRAPWASGGLGGAAGFSFGGGSAPPVPPIPFSLPTRATTMGAPDSTSAGPMDVDTSRPTTASDMQSPQSESTGCPACLAMSSSMHSSTGSGNGDYGKLNRGDEGYGGLFGRPSTPEPGEGLLAQRLKGLGVQRGAKPDMDM